MSAFTFNLKPGEFAQLCNMGEGWSVALAIHNQGPNRIKLRDAFVDRETIEPGHMTIQIVRKSCTNLYRERGAGRSPDNRFSRSLSAVQILT